MKKILFVIACILSISALGLLLLANHHRCSKIDVISVFSNDKKLDGSSLYQCRDDSLVLLSSGTYVIYPASRKVGLANAHDFYEFQFGLISRTMPVNSVILGEVQAKTDDIQPNLLIEPNLIEFSTVNNRKISIRK